MGAKKIVFIGVDHESHVGRQLKTAASKLGIESWLYDSRQAYKGPKILEKLGWWIDKRPQKLHSFSQRVFNEVKRNAPSLIVTTGMAPMEHVFVKEIRSMSIPTINFSTDDPWNSAHRAGWFMKALKQYDRVFSTRRANLEQFRELGVQAEHLPFGYDPDLYFAPWENRTHPESNLDKGEGIRDRVGEEEKVFLAGGGDADRYPLVRALTKAGVDLSLWGGYWEKAGLKSGGFLDAAGIRREAARCMVSLVVVRKANRDGSAMRSFEIPACGACCVAEDTEEHREMFGPDGEAVLYFRTPEELVRRVKEAFVNPELRKRLRRNVHKAITGRPNTYVDRLKTILERVEEKNRIGDRE
jgi:spore maturation protein CgeB